MHLDLSVLPVPVVPIHENVGTGTKTASQPIDFQEQGKLVPVVPVVPIGFEASHAQGLRPVTDYTAPIVTAAALSLPLPAGVEQERRPERARHANESTVHECMTCEHWGGVGTFQQDGRTGTQGLCAAGFKPWRKTNIPSLLQYYQWHYIGQCAELQPGEEEPDA
ncbi:hypothetical protein QU481_14055 [Crenobacter sp. SG2303]|uniref:Uncharacterized protein n=1 Tax=Crenobacter oryzisoli TaxID=3056844 RepID=A0ABT7XQL8_9NEIS|nr:hypothetical protein [Crenobacter sp. SG2303]MDN0076010.1 hypothetical protein [Crenobacter sp. SG2303]